MKKTNNNFAFINVELVRVYVLIIVAVVVVVDVFVSFILNILILIFLNALDFFLLYILRFKNFLFFSLHRLALFDAIKEERERAARKREQYRILVGYIVYVRFYKFLQVISYI